MNRLIVILSLISVGAVAQEYIWCQLGPVTSGWANVMSLDMTDPEDRKDYSKRELPMPPAYPALVHPTTGLMVVQPDTVRAGKQAILAQLDAVVSNQVDAALIGYLKPTTNVTAIVGTNRANWRIVRYTGSMTTAQQLTLDRWSIIYLSARLQVMEQLLADKSIVNVRKTLNRETE